MPFCKARPPRQLAATSGRVLVDMRVRAMWSSRCSEQLSNGLLLDCGLIGREIAVDGLVHGEAVDVFKTFDFEG
jgi:hypothetical protein